MQIGLCGLFLSLHDGRGRLVLSAFGGCGGLKFGCGNEPRLGLVFLGTLLFQTRFFLQVLQLFQCFEGSVLKALFMAADGFERSGCGGLFLDEGLDGYFVGGIDEPDEEAGLSFHDTADAPQAPGVVHDSSAAGSEVLQEGLGE